MSLQHTRTSIRNTPVDPIVRKQRAADVTGEGCRRCLVSQEVWLEKVLEGGENNHLACKNKSQIQAEGLVYCCEEHTHAYSFEEDRHTGPNNGKFFFFFETSVKIK